MVRQAHHPEPSRRVNLKLQYSMTTEMQRVGRFSLQARRHVWDFYFWSLDIICYLVIVIWNLING